MSDMTFDGGPNSHRFENQSYLESGKPLPKVAPLRQPARFIAAIATQVSEVMAGVRSVEQTAPYLSEQVYLEVKQRAAQKARYRLAKKRPVSLKPTGLLRVKYQQPARGVIESVVIMGDRERSRAITIRLEESHTCWRATSIGFI